MKQVLLIITMVITTMIAANAQKPAVQPEKKFYMALAAGPAFPVGAFAASDMNSNAESGFAKTGFNINLQVGYNVNESYALVAQMLYAKHSINQAISHVVGASADHWQYYGMLIGPALTLKAGNNVRFDLRTLGGITRVNSPAFSYNNTELVKEDWATAFTLQLGADVRYFFAGNVFLFGNTDYNFMRPKFTVAAPDGSVSEKAEQKIDLINVNAGIGIRF